jgi:plasmid stabilization system protein ParE
MDGQASAEMRIWVPQNYAVNVVEMAEGDLDEIDEYIFSDSPQNARAVKEELRTAIRSLSIFPQRFKVFEANRNPDEVVRSMPVTSCVVFYRIIESASIVEVLTVRRGTRDRPARFFR